MRIRPPDIMSHPWVVALLLLIVLAAPRPCLAFVFCAVHPLNPLCCPSPCPVMDMAKLSRFVEEAQDTWSTVEKCRAMADQYARLFHALGPQGELAVQARRLPGQVNGVFTTFKAALPDMVKPGDLGDPHAVAEILKKTLFDPDRLDAATLSSHLGQVRTRAGLAADETFNALATGLHGYARLTDVMADGGRQIVTAAQARHVREDMAANTGARQALVDNMGGLAELLSAWAAAEATRNATRHGNGLGALPGAKVVPVSADDGLAGIVGRLERLRQARDAVHAMDVTISALTALHNERHAAQVIFAQYPGLRNTVASDEAAIRFRADEEVNAVRLLSTIFTDGDAAFQLVRTRLLALDTTQWTDNVAKGPAAAAAAEAVVAAIEADPQAFGTPTAYRPMRERGSSGDDRLWTALEKSFSAWLEDDKLERFWHPLRQAADAAIARLDQRLAEIGQRCGFDILGGAAAAEETRLLGQFRQEAAALGSVGAADFDQAQKAAVASYASAFRTAAADAQADAGAARFVTVAWPQ